MCWWYQSFNCPLVSMVPESVWLALSPCLWVDGLSVSVPLGLGLYLRVPGCFSVS